MRRTPFFAALAMVSAAAALAAQEFSGSIEGRMGWYWKSASLIPLTQVLEGGVDGKVGDPDRPAAQYSARLKAAYDPSSGTTTAELGEAWIKAFAGPFDLSVGNQVVAWGSSDVFIPSDAANPMDLSLPFDPIKMPVPMGRIIYNGEGFTVDLEAQPFWIAPVLSGEPWAASSSLPASVNAVGFDWGNVAYGGHVKASLGLLQGLDIGITAYRGRNSVPTSIINFSGAAPTSITLNYDRLTLLAADAVLAPGAGFLVKTEWGYRTLRDTSLFEPEAGAASLQGVSGLEYTLGPLQLIGEYVLDWAKDPEGAGDSIEHSAVAIVSWDGGGRASMKVAAVHRFDGDGVIAPQFTYTIADGLQLTCGIFYFYGDSDSTYGAWAGNSLGRLSIKYSF